MRIQVRGAAPNHNFEVDVEPEWTVRRLKEFIADTLQMTSGTGGVTMDEAIERIRLICMARVMDNAQTLGQLNVQAGQTIHVVVRQPAAAAPAGGPATTSPHAATAGGASTVPPPPPLGGTSPNMAANPIAAPVDVFGQLMQGVTGGLQSMLMGVQQQQQQQRTAAAAANAPNPADPAAPAQQPQQMQQRIHIMQGPPHHLHHLHHHHHHHHMQQHQVHPLMFQPPPPPPFVAGVHVHVHVNLSELEELPDRLLRLQQRAPFVASVQTHTTPTTAAQPPTPAAVPAAPAVAPAAAAAARAAPPTAAPASSSAAPRPVPAPTAQQPVAAPAAAAAAATTPAAAAPNPSGPRPALSHLAAMAGIDAGVDEAPQSLLDVISQTIMSNFNVPEVMMLVGGVWTPLERVRDPAISYLRQQFASQFPEQMRGTREARQRFSATSATSIVRWLVENAEVYNLLRPRQRDGTNLMEALERWLYHLILEFTDLLLDGGSGTQFTGPLRVILVRSLGRLFQYAPRELLRNGPQDLDFIVQNLIRIAMTTAATSPQMGGLGAQLQTMGPMAINIITQTLAGWNHEFVHRFRQPATDDGLFLQAVPQFAPVVAPAPPPPPQPASGDVDIDTLLDNALDEAIPASAGDLVQEDAGSSRGRAALLAGGIPLEEVDSMLQHLQQPAATAADRVVTGGADAAPSPIFRELYGPNKSS